MMVSPHRRLTASWLAVAVVATLCASASASGWDWRSTEHGHLATPVRNFLALPGKQCGSAGWVFAATGMLADRLAVLQPGKVKVQLSNQVLINCLADVDACKETRSIGLALQHVLDNDGIPDRTCLSMRGEKERCGAMCVNCVPAPTVRCEPKAAYFKYGITSFAEVPVAAPAMREEVRERGPIACELRGGLYGVVVGFSEIFSDERFLVRYDRGTFYGQDGYGNATLGDFVNCWQATVKKPFRYIDEELRTQQIQQQQQQQLSLRGSAGQALPGGFNDGHGASPGRLASGFDGQWPSPATAAARARAGGRAEASVARRLLSVAELPASFSWLDVGGLASVTPMQSHHNGGPGASPGYCGACWAMASAAVLSDRLKIMRGGPNASDVFISPQNTVDCVRGPHSVGCGGGEGNDVFPHWMAHGTVDETCNAWVNEEQECRAAGLACKQCDAEGACEEVPAGKFRTYGVEAWGLVSGEEAIMNEVLARGPLDCGIATPPALGEDLFGPDVICDEDTLPGAWEITHDVSIVGWTTEPDGKKTWQIRNSWGTAWGDEGFAKVCRGRNGTKGNMLLESNCLWVVPSVLS